MASSEEFTITNSDTGEVMGLDDAAEKFSFMSLSGFGGKDAKADAKVVGAVVTEGEEEEEDDYFDAKQSSNLSLSKNSEGTDAGYVPLIIPDGGILNFCSISAVGTARDGAENKAYSVYYIDVKCSASVPSNWFVYRRYSQFRRLSDVLRSEGYYVPVLPPKRILGTFTPEFVRQRRADLETWLNNLAVQHTIYAGEKDT